MSSITFRAVYGDKWKIVKIYHGNDLPSVWQVLISNEFQGTIFYENNQWHYNFNENSELATEDIYIIINIITQNHRQGYYDIKL